MKIAVFIFVFLTQVSLAETPKDTFLSLQSELLTQLCKDRLKQLSEFRLLFVLPRYQELLKTGKTSESLRKALETWSADLILKIALQIHGEFQSVCSGNPKMDLTLKELERAYLVKLGLTSKDYKESELTTLFHSLIAIKEDQSAIIKRLGELKKTKIKGLKFLEGLYGGFSKVQGIGVLSTKKLNTQKLESLVGDICPKVDCPFWSQWALSKVVISDERGLAAFLPEVATLVVSQELLDEPNLLMKIIVMHELAHVAEKTAWNKDHKDLKAEFSEISLWKTGVEKLANTREDLLTEMSKGSLYSILPDAIYVRVDPKTKEKEGFVFARSYTETLKREDTSEDLADSIAVFKIYPQRFCLDGKPFAPKKFKWIKENFYPQSADLKCGPL